MPEAHLVSSVCTLVFPRISNRGSVRSKIHLPGQMKIGTTMAENRKNLKPIRIPDSAGKLRICTWWKKLDLTVDFVIDSLCDKETKSPVMHFSAMLWDYGFSFFSRIFQLNRVNQNAICGLAIWFVNVAKKFVWVIPHLLRTHRQATQRPVIFVNCPYRISHLITQPLKPLPRHHDWFHMGNSYKNRCTNKRFSGCLSARVSV